MRTTVTLDDDVSIAPEPSPQLKRGRRFVAFDVPAGTRLIASSRIQAALDEHGVV